MLNQVVMRGMAHGSNHPSCVTAVSFQTEEVNSNLTVNIVCNFAENDPHFKTETFIRAPSGPELVS